MLSRHITLSASIVAVAASCFTLGVVHSRRSGQADHASYDARLEALRTEFHSALAREGRAGGGPTGTYGLLGDLEGLENRPGGPAADSARGRIIAEIKQQLQSEMGLLPVSLLRERRSSFVALSAYDNRGHKSYGTAGYLGGGYFITVKHGVVALGGDDGRSEPRRVVSIKVLYKGKQLPARVVDSGNATVEVHSGDWAIIKVRDELDLPPLRPDFDYEYQFADPIFRLGNDYSRGIIVSTGYIGQKIANGLVTCLTDGHPGVSGGGVLDQEGNLVGIPIGRLDGDYRFSFILPLRTEMFRKVPGMPEASALRTDAPIND